MKAITIKQPWAQLICEGLKDIENRTWPTRYRGRVLIHAGLCKKLMDCKVYFKDSLLKQVGIARESLYCVGRNYNMFRQRTKQTPERAIHEYINNQNKHYGKY